MKGAEVGTNRDSTLAAGSSRTMGWGWAWGKANPGGIDGVEDRDTWFELFRLGGTESSSATRASTDEVASSREGRPWSSGKAC